MRVSSQSESLSQLRSDSHRPLLALKRMVSRSAGTSIRHSNRTTPTSRSAATNAFPSVSRTSPYASSDCVATLKRFAGQAGFSETVAGQLAPCRRKSTRLNYQARWVQSLPLSVLRAHNSEGSGIFDLFIQNREGCCIDYQRLQSVAFFCV